MHRKFERVFILLMVMPVLQVSSNDKAQNKRQTSKSNECISLNIDLNIHGVERDGTCGGRTMGEYTNPGNKPINMALFLEYTE